jgi:hypothetical protein
VSERAEVHRSRDSSMESLCLSEPSFEFKARPVPKSARRPRAPPGPAQRKELTTPVRDTLRAHGPAHIDTRSLTHMFSMRTHMQLHGCATRSCSPRAVS